MSKIHIPVLLITLLTESKIDRVKLGAILIGSLRFERIFSATKFRLPDNER